MFAHLRTHVAAYHFSDGVPPAAALMCALILENIDKNVEKLHDDII